MCVKEFEEVILGCTLVSECIAEAIQIARQKRVLIRQELNGVAVYVQGDSDADLILRDYKKAIGGYMEKKVGPYPLQEVPQKDTK